VKHGDARARGQSKAGFIMPWKWSAVAEADGWSRAGLWRGGGRKKEGTWEHDEKEKAF